MLSRDAKDVLN